MYEEREDTDRITLQRLGIDADAPITLFNTLPVHNSYINSSSNNSNNNSCNSTDPILSDSNKVIPSNNNIMIAQALTNTNNTKNSLAITAACDTPTVTATNTNSNDMIIPMITLPPYIKNRDYDDSSDTDEIKNKQCHSSSDMNKSNNPTTNNKINQQAKSLLQAFTNVYNNNNNNDNNNDDDDIEDDDEDDGDRKEQLRHVARDYDDYISNSDCDDDDISE